MSRPTAEQIAAEAKALRAGLETVAQVRAVPLSPAEAVALMPHVVAALKQIDARLGALEIHIRSAACSGAKRTAQ